MDDPELSLEELLAPEIPRSRVVIDEICKHFGLSKAIVQNEIVPYLSRAPGITRNHSVVYWLDEAEELVAKREAARAKARDQRAVELTREHLQWVLSQLTDAERSVLEASLASSGD